MVKEINFRKMRNNIQQKMFEDMRRIKESDGIFVKSDKSGNLYEIEKGKYKQIIFKEVFKHYRKAPPDHNKDDRCSFIKYDIREFYPSITERTLDRALDLAKEYMVIPLDKVEIIKHCRKTLLQ